ncbi:hypothetical protein [Dactylosporangium sp. NPDC006015]|uniref:hypothetical protein n=1 Tax=Dactylosporangium sp. NPDC006015 TaxID=3154576 RepID=UPI0033BDD155
MSKILITGMSGTDKSSALSELARHGYRVVDTDDPGRREHRGEWLWVFRECWLA